MPCVYNNTFIMKSVYLILFISIIGLTACNSGDPVQLLAEGKEKITNKDYKGALEALDKAVRLDGGNAEIYYYRGTTKGRLRDLSGAIEDISKAIELKPDYAKAYGNRGLAYFKNGNRAEALQDFNKAIEFDTISPNNYYNRGIWHYQKGEGDLVKACEDWSRAKSLGHADNNGYYSRFCTESK